MNISSMPVNTIPQSSPSAASVPARNQEAKQTAAADQFTPAAKEEPGFLQKHAKKIAVGATLAAPMLIGGGIGYGIGSLLGLGSFGCSMATAAATILSAPVSAALGFCMAYAAAR